MKLHTLKSALLAIAGLALIASSAKAQTVYNDGDIFIGFNNGGTNDYLIDVGQASQFVGVTGTVNLSIGNTGADLSAIFGAGWDSSSALKWGAAGATTFGDGAANPNTVWATSTSTTPWSNSFDQSTPVSALATIGGNFGGNSSTANSSVALEEATSGAASWASFESVANGGTGANSTAGSFAYFVPGVVGTTTQNLYLSQLNEGDTSAGPALGFFSIASNGQISFTAAAAPEPSTYALMILGGAALLFVSRFARRSDLA